MAHRIEQYDKQQGVKQAWHGLTEVVEEIKLDDNWLSQWEIRPVELFRADGSKTRWNVLECSDVQLEIGQPYNPETFKPIDNKAFLELVRDSIGGTGHKIVSVGSVRNRGRTFVSIELIGMEQFKAAGREFSAFLNFGNGHDKSSVLWVNTSNVCTVCDNTFGANLVQIENKESKDSSDDIKLRLRHTKNATLRFPELAKLINGAIGVQAEFQIELDKLAKIKVSEKVSENLFAGFIGRNVQEIDKGLSTRARNTVSRLGELFRGGAGNKGESLADSFSAVTDYYTHESSGGDNKLRQVVSSEYGAGQVAKSDFWRMVRSGDKRKKTVSRGETLLAHTS
ncbi:MAG: DUF932 domain-containing protein [bacterium]|nr:DUF932 domain-containing protein [bacterium]